jgi:hypothetical protein
MSSIKNNNVNNETIVSDNARTVSHRDLLPIKPEYHNGGTILLFLPIRLFQAIRLESYVESLWTKSEHK